MDIGTELLDRMYTEALEAPMPCFPCLELAMPVPSAEILKRMTWERVRKPADRKTLLDLIDSDLQSAIPYFSDALYTCVDFALKCRLGVKAYARRGNTARAEYTDSAEAISVILRTAGKALEQFGIKGEPIITLRLK